MAVPPPFRKPISLLFSYDGPLFGSGRYPVSGMWLFSPPAHSPQVNLASETGRFPRPFPCKAMSSLWLLQANLDTVIED